MHRAKQISKLNDTDFNVIPIFSILIRAMGENFALYLLTIGFSGTLMLWFSNFTDRLWMFLAYIPFIAIDSSFVGGLLFLLMSIVLAFTSILVSYFLAENTLIFAEIARNTRPLQKDGKEKIESLLT